MYVYLYTYICIYIASLLYIHTHKHGSGSKPRVVARLPPSVTRLCRSRLFQTLCRGFLAAVIQHIPSSWRLVFRGFVAAGFVAEHPHLLQSYVAKWPPKPVTNPMFLISCRISSNYIYTYILTYRTPCCMRRDGEPQFKVSHFTWLSYSNCWPPSFHTIRVQVLKNLVSTSNHSYASQYRNPRY